MNGKTSYRPKLVYVTSAVLLGVAQTAAAQEFQFGDSAQDAVIQFVQQPGAPAVAPPRTRRPDSLARFDSARSRQLSRTGLARVPNMFGDDLGIAIVFARGNFPVFTQPIPLGGTLRRTKVAENESALPQNRWIFGYNFFNDPIGGITDVNHYEVGLEQTFWDGDASLQIRVPFASTLASDQFATLPSADSTEFGNLYFLSKTVLVETDDAVLTGGLGLTVPTADDSRLFIPGGSQILEVDNDAVHLLPYLGIVWTRSELLFFQSFVQLDMDVNGNDVSADVFGANRAPIGVYQDPLTMIIDVGTGIWLMDDPGRYGVTSMAALLELHYATALQDADRVAGGGIAVVSPNNRIDEVNLSAGLSVLWNDAVTVRPAMVVPLRTGPDRAFDYEFMLQVNLWR